MPIEPATSPWVFPDVRSPEFDDDLVAVGADLEPGTLLAAYRRGLFPMPGRPGEIWWYSPIHRGILPPDGLRVTRSLRKSLKHFEIRVDTAFVDVVRACADPTRDGAWIDQGRLPRIGPILRDALHSIARDRGDLAGSQVDPPDAPIIEVGHVKRLARFIEREAVDAAELRL